MSKHTPGPWIESGPSFGDSLPRYTTEIITEWENDDNDNEIKICTLPFNHWDAENEANARLIASAPDLLDALKMLLSYTRACEDLLNASPAGQIDLAKAAILKAQGEIE